MPARPRGSARGSFRRISSTIRKLDKRKKAKTPPPPPRISSRVRSSSPLRRSRASRSTRDTTFPRSPPKRRLSCSPGKSIARKPRVEVRQSLEPKRTADPPKNRERTPEKKYVDKLLCEGPSKEHPTPSYIKGDIKNINIVIPNRYGEKFGSDYESNRVFNRIFNPDNLQVPRREGEGVRPIFNRLDPRKFDEYDEGPSHPDQMDLRNYNDGIRENSTRQYFIKNEKERTVHHSRRPLRDECYYREDRVRDNSRYQPSTSFDRSKDYPPERKDRYDDRDDVSRGPRQSLERNRERKRDRECERERDRCRDRERDRVRGRSVERLIRRQPSLSPRTPSREFGDRRPRSLERRPRSPLERSQSEQTDLSCKHRYSTSDHSVKSRGYYEANRRENPSPSSRGRGRGFHSRARGGSVIGRPYIRNTALIPPMRAIRGDLMPRVPMLTRRLPFPPRKSFQASMQGRY